MCLASVMRDFQSLMAPPECAGLRLIIQISREMLCEHLDDGALRHGIPAFWFLHILKISRVLLSEC